ncbi:MAG: hypothetical protein IPK26_19250 [Planctomycetes bacterium]|nr:hypothetical protein [Planctomycetota bacterium]
MSSVRPDMSPECRRILAELPESLVALEMPGHARICVSCAARWQAACRLAGWLRQRPPIPDALLGPAGFEAVVDRLVAEAERAPLGRTLATVLVQTPAPTTESVPATELCRRLLATPVPAPAQLWPRVRHEVNRQVAGQLWPMRRLWLAGVAGAAALVFGLLVLDRQGTQVQVAIVFEDMTVAPDIAIMPVSVLRSNLR